MSDNLQEFKEMNQAVLALRETVEKNNAGSSEIKEMLAKTEIVIQKGEDATNELAKKNAAVEKKSIELEGQLVDMQSEMIRMTKSNVSGQDWRESPEYKALNAFAKGGEKGLIKFQGLETKDLLRTDNDTQGGYLIQSEMANTIINKIVEISPVRSVSRVMTVGKKTIDMPKRSTIPTATYEGEAEAVDPSSSTYASESLTAYRLTAAVQATNDMLIDTNFDLATLIAQDVAEAFAFKEGQKFVNGTGAKEPEGFLSNATVIANATEAAAAGVISGDDLLLLTGDLKVGYNPMYAFSRRTLAYIRTLKGTTNDHYIWQAGLAPNVPGTIAGAPYIVLNDMPDYDAAAGNIPVMYADFARGYQIIDRTGITMIRDELSGSRNAIVEWVFHTYNTGQVILPEAFAGLKIKA